MRTEKAERDRETDLRDDKLRVVDERLLGERRAPVRDDGAFDDGHHVFVAELFLAVPGVHQTLDDDL